MASESGILNVTSAMEQKVDRGLPGDMPEDQANQQEPQVDNSVKGALKSLRGTPIKTFWICLFVWTFVNLEQSLFGYAVPGIMKEFDIDIKTIGLILSAGFLFATVGAVAAGILTDRYGRKKSLVACFSLSGFMYGMQGVSPFLSGLTISRLLGTGLSAGLSPITNSYVAESAPPRIRALMVGFLQIGFPLGWFLASIVVVPLLDIFGWRAIFLFSFLSLPIAWLIYRVIPETVRFQAVAKSKANQIGWRKQLGLLFEEGQKLRAFLCIAAFFTKGGAYAGLAFYLPTFLNEVRGYEMATSAKIVGLSYAIGIFGYIAASFVGEFLLSRKVTIVLWCWLGAVALVGFIWLPRSPLEDILLCGLMAFFSFGTAAILTTFVLEQFPTRIRATGAACASASVSLGFAVFPLLVASLVGHIGWQWSISLVVTPMLFLSGCAVLGMKSVKAGEEMADF